MAVFLPSGHRVLNRYEAIVGVLKMRAGNWLLGLGASVMLGMASISAAHADFAQAMASYRSGDVSSAFQQFQAAAESGDRYAQVMIANMYLEGSGVPRSPEKAASWFEKAAAGGHSYAQYALGLLYMSGQGVPKNLATGVGWLDKAARQGSFFAQTTLGDAYANGLGVSVDKSRAISYYTSAAEQNYALAQLKLASAYYLGTGVSKNLPEAYKWAYLAALQLSSATTILQKFKSELPATDISRGETSAKSWLAGRGSR